MAKRNIEKLTACANCNTPLAGENFCPNCGQKNTRPDLNFGHFLSESISTFFAFDNRFFITLHHLFRYPGKVPKDFVSGKRIAYLNPIRIYLVTSILLIFIGSSDLINSDKQIINTSVNTTEKEELTEQRKEELKTIWKTTDNSDDISLGDRMEAFVMHYPETTQKIAFDSLGIKDTWKNDITYSTRTKRLTFDEGRFNDWFISKLVWILFLFLPFLAVWLKLVYIRRNIHYLSHLFFSFYSQAAFFMLLSIGLLLIPVIEGIGVFCAFALFSVYLILALKKFYGQSWGKSIFKFFLINLGYIIIFIGVTGVASFVIYMLF